MFDADSRDRRRGSLLSFGSSTPGETAAARPDSPPSGRYMDQPGDALARHRLARSQREAAAATAAPSFDEPEPDAADNAPGGLRALIRDRLLGRMPTADHRLAPAGEPETAVDARRTADATVERPAWSSADDELRGTGPRDDETWRPLIDPMKVIMGVVNSKALIASTTALGVLLGVAIALSTPKKYESAAEILIDPRDLKLVDRDLTQVGLPSDATLAIVENQVRVLTSGTVLNKVVDKLNLADDPEFNGERAGGLGSIISELRSLLSRRDASAAGDRKRALAVEHLAESLSVERGGKTFVIVVAVTTEEGEKSALIANTMTDVFLQTYGELQSGTAGRASGELNARLDELRAGVEAAERKVEMFKAQNDLIDAQGRLITDDEIVKLNEQLGTARARTLELNAKAASSRGMDVDDALGGTLPEELTSNVMTELRSQYAALKQEADRLSVRLGPRHPERLAAEAQLAGARGQIANELRRIVASAQTELKRAVQLEQELSARLAQLKVRQGSVSDDLVTLRELERDAAAKRAVYEAFLLRAKETGEQKDINTANMSVISRAFAPLNPLGPSRSMIALTGAMLGFFAGAGLGGARGAWQSLRESTATRPRRSQSRMRPGATGPFDTSPPEPPQPRGSARHTPPGPPPSAADATFVRQMHEAATATSTASDRPASGWPNGRPGERAEQPPVVETASADRLPRVANPYADQPLPQTPPMVPGRFHQSGEYGQSHYGRHQQPAHFQPAVAQDFPQQFVPVYPPVPVQQSWPPVAQGFQQPLAYPAAFPPQFVPMTPPYPYPQPMANQHVHGPDWGTRQAAQGLHPAPRHAANEGTREDADPIDEIRDSLRDFREAVRAFAENRSRRRSN